MAAGYRSPSIALSLSSTNARSFTKSSDVNWTLAAPKFSSIYGICFEPERGITPWAMSHAIETCAAVALWPAPISLSPSTSLRMLGKFSLLNLPMCLRKSVASKSSGDF